jgi:hypothetical protein
MDSDSDVVVVSKKGLVESERMNWYGLSLVSFESMGRVSDSYHVK